MEGAFTRQDLVMLRWRIPQNFQAGGSYLINLHSWALRSTMSDVNSRLMMIVSPTEAALFRIDGARRS